VSPDSITSTNNPVVKSLAKLKKRSERDERGVFIIEGYRPVSRAMAAGFHLESLYVCPELFLGKNEPALIEQAETAGTQIITLGAKAFAKIAYRDRPEGLIATGKQWHTTLNDLTLPENPFLIVVESIEKPGNLGTILRSADAAGCGGAGRAYLESRRGAAAMDRADGVASRARPHPARASFHDYADHRSGRSHAATKFARHRACRVARRLDSV